MRCRSLRLEKMMLFDKTEQGLADSPVAFHAVMTVVGVKVRISPGFAEWWPELQVQPPKAACDPV